MKREQSGNLCPGVTVAFIYLASSADGDDDLAMAYTVETYTITDSLLKNPVQLHYVRSKCENVYYNPQLQCVAAT